LLRFGIRPTQAHPGKLGSILGVSTSVLSNKRSFRVSSKICKGKIKIKCPSAYCQRLEGLSTPLLLFLSLSINNILPPLSLELPAERRKASPADERPERAERRRKQPTSERPCGSTIVWIRIESVEPGLSVSEGRPRTLKAGDLPAGTERITSGGKTSRGVRKSVDGFRASVIAKRSATQYRGISSFLYCARFPSQKCQRQNYCPSFDVNEIVRKINRAIG